MTRRNEIAVGHREHHVERRRRKAHAARVFLAVGEPGILRELAHRRIEVEIGEAVAESQDCDGGVTWSGIQLVNGPEGSIQGMLYPELIPVGGSMNMFAWDRNSQKTLQMTFEP